MPVFAEQVRNALIAKQLGFAEYVNKMSVTSTELLTEIQKILTSDSYAASVTRVRDLIVDRMLHPLDEGAFWLEKAIRYEVKRPMFFKRKGMYLYSFSFLYFDLALALGIVVNLLAK